jgi:hypothetical protein
MDASSQALRMLTEIGVAASGAGLIGEATAIFDGIEAMRPGSEAAGIGTAVAQLNARAFEDAIKTLRTRVLAKHPASIEAKMFLALALKFGGRNAECDSVIKELTASGDATAQAFAASLK